MSTPRNPEDQRRDRKSKIYFSIAVAFLMVMGFVWSLDAFFVYISLGVAVFFFFLGFKNRRVSVPQQKGKYYHKPRPGRDPDVASHHQQATKSAFDALKEALEKGSIGQPQPQSESQTQSQPSSSKKDVRTVVLSCAFIFFVFTIIFIVMIFGESESYSEDASSYFSTAEQFLWSGQYDSAKVYYRRAFTSEPEYVEALNGYGNALMYLNNYDSALIMMDKALEINPDYEYGMYCKALVLFYKQNYGQSRKLLFDLLDKNPTYYDAMILAGDDYYVEQRNDSAFYWYQEAYNNGARSAGLSRVLAEINDTKNNRDKAIGLYKESLNYDSTNVKIYERLSELLPGRDGDVFRKEGKKWKDAGY